MFVVIWQYDDCIMRVEVVASEEEARELVAAAEKDLGDVDSVRIYPAGFGRGAVDWAEYERLNGVRHA